MKKGLSLSRHSSSVYYDWVVVADDVDTHEREAQYYSSLAGYSYLCSKRGEGLLRKPEDEVFQKVPMKNQDS